MIFEQGRKLQELTLWTTEGTSAQGLHVSQHRTGAAVAEGRRCQVNRHLQGNGHQVMEDPDLERRAAAGYLT